MTISEAKLTEKNGVKFNWERVEVPVSIITGHRNQTQKEDQKMRKIFAGILMTVMLLSGCGAVKNLENPGLSEIAKPKFGGDTYVPVEGQFWAK